MQKFAPIAQAYIKKHKQARGLTYAYIAEVSNTPIDSLKKFLTSEIDENSKSPEFNYVMSWICAVGDIYECLGIEPPAKPDSQYVAEIKEMYEVRIADMKEMTEQRIRDITNLYEARIADLKNEPIICSPFNATYNFKPHEE